MLILLDPDHGHNTPGKRSLDGTLLEYAYTRDPDSSEWRVLCKFYKSYIWD